MSKPLTTSAPPNPCADLPLVWALLILAAGSVLFTMAQLWGLQGYPCHHDFLFHAWRYGESASDNSWWFTVMAKDYAGRHHFFSAMLFRLIYPFWGLSMTGYVLVGILFHVLNTFLLFFFCRLLGSTAFAALAATLLFLTSSLCWGSVSNALDGLIRHPGLTFYLLAIMTAWHACAKNRPVFFFLSFSFTLNPSLAMTTNSEKIMFLVFKIFCFVPSSSSGCSST